MQADVRSQITVSTTFNMSGKKPWENTQMIPCNIKVWDVKHYTSLNLLAAILGIASPKDDIDGSKVGKYTEGF